MTLFLFGVAVTTTALLLWYQIASVKEDAHSFHQQIKDAQDMINALSKRVTTIQRKLKQLNEDEG